MMIRPAVPGDTERILEIYAPYILSTTITFEYEVPSAEEFRRRFERVTAKYPWIVWEENGRILGYAYADTAFARAAYAWDADLSVYLDESARGRGIGGKLVLCIEEMLIRRGYHNLYSLITGENDASVRFHHRLGYSHLGTLPQTGYKFGRWLDVFWYGKRLRPADAVGAPPPVFEADEQDRMRMCEISQSEEA